MPEKVRYRAGCAEHLGVPAGSLSSFLAWVSIIRIAPVLIGDARTEFARCVHPGSLLALGFFTGPVLRLFDHGRPHGAILARRRQPRSGSVWKDDPPLTTQPTRRTDGRHT